MRRIRKSAEPDSLRAWRDALRPRGSIPPWDDFPDPPRAPVRAQLAVDQGHICCYCAGTIARGNFHIEHFRPRESRPELTYRWNNLLASCQTSGRASRTTTVIKTQQHCGAAKDNWFEEAVTISPLEASVGSLFRYTLRGMVYPNKALRVRYAHVELTIAKLNLNAPMLVARRSEILKKATEDASNLSRTAWLARYLEPNAEGQLQEFWSALQYNYEKFWSRGLA